MVWWFMNTSRLSNAVIGSAVIIQWLTMGVVPLMEAYRDGKETS